MEYDNLGHDPDVQLIGGVVLHEEKLQMATGKNAGGYPSVFLNALAGRVHSYGERLLPDVTQMDGASLCSWAQSGCLDKHQPNSEERRRAYRQYYLEQTTNLALITCDNMAINEIGQKAPLCIVDEVDSVLVDVPVLR